MTIATTNRLPGDRSAKAETARMIRVDHAGEYGAKQIYAGQLAVLGRGPKGDLIRAGQAWVGKVPRLIGPARHQSGDSGKADR